MISNLSLIHRKSAYPMRDMRFFWRGRRDLNYKSSFYRLKLREIPYENQYVFFIAYNGVQSDTKLLGEKIGEISGAKNRGRTGLRPLF